MAGSITEAQNSERAATMMMPATNSFGLSERRLSFYRAAAFTFDCGGNRFMLGEKCGASRYAVLAIAWSTAIACLNMSSSITAPPLSGNVMGTVDNAFVVAEWRDAGGSAGPPRLIAPPHVHYSDDEAWYVLEGDLCVQVGRDNVEAHAGSGVFVPRGTPHTYWNPGPGPVRYLLVMTSNIFQLIQAIHQMVDRTPATLAAVFRKHDSEVVEMEIPG